MTIAVWEWHNSKMTKDDSLPSFDTVGNERRQQVICCGEIFTNGLCRNKVCWVNIKWSPRMPSIDTCVKFGAAMWDCILIMLSLEPSA